MIPQKRFLNILGILKPMGSNTVKARQSVTKVRINTRHFFRQIEISTVIIHDCTYVKPPLKLEPYDSVLNAFLLLSFLYSQVSSICSLLDVTLPQYEIGPQPHL